MKFDEYGKIVSLGSVNGVLSSYDSNNLKFALNSLEENKVDTSSIKVQPFSEEGYEYWARDFTEYSSGDAIKSTTTRVRFFWYSNT